MNRKIVTSLVSSGVMLSLVVGATFAYFNDQGTSTGNAFSAGSIDLKMSNDGVSYDEDTTATWTLTDAAPGDTFFTDLRIRNTGSLEADHIDLQFSNTVVAASSGPGTVETVPLDSVIEITDAFWDSDGDQVFDTPIMPLITNQNGNLIIDLDDLEALPSNDLVNLPFTGAQGGDHLFRIAGRLHPTIMTNQNQGDSMDMTMSVLLNQHSSQ